MLSKMLFSVSSLTITDHYCTCSHLFYIPKLLILWHLKCYVYVAVTSQFCDFMSLCCLVGLSGRVVLILLDYVICVPLCSRLISILEKQKEWAEICTILSEFTRFTFNHLSVQLVFLWHMWVSFWVKWRNFCKLQLTVSNWPNACEKMLSSNRSMVL